MKAHDEERIPRHLWRSDGHAIGRFVRDRPMRLSIRGIQADHGFPMPNQQPPLAAMRGNDRRTIAWFFRGQRTPTLGPSRFVVGDHGRPLTADDADQLIAIHQRMRGPSPGGRLQSIVLLEVLRPHHFPSGDFQAPEMPLGTQSIHA